MAKEKNQKQKSLIRRLILILFLVIMGSFSIAILLSVERVRKVSTSATISDLTLISELYSDLASDYVQDCINALDAYVLSDVVYEGESVEEIGEWITTTESRRPEVFEYVLFVGRDGNSYYDSGETSYHGDRDYFSEIMEGKEYVVNDPKIAKATGQISLLIVRAARDQNSRIMGMFVGVCPIEYLQNLTDSLDIGELGFAFMLDGKGNVIAHQDTEQVFEVNYLTDTDYGATEVATLMTEGKRGSLECTINGTPSFLCYAPVIKSSWSIAICVPNKQLNSTANQIRNFLIASNSVVGILNVVVMAFLVLFSIKPLREVVTTITGIASGNADLTQRIALKVHNEIGAVVIGFNSFVEKLQSIITKIKESKSHLSDVYQNLQQSVQDTDTSIDQIVEQIEVVKSNISKQEEGVQGTAGAVTQISANINSLEKMIEGQASGVTEASAAVEQMIGNISSVNSSVEKMATSFDELRGNVENGAAKQKTVNEQIGQIERQSVMLQDANTIIATIAEQTNLLAMNAAIEAAHAGEAGKGFSVVADEIRKLSETSSEQSHTIGVQLNKIKESIGSVVTSSEESSRAFSSVTSNIESTDCLVRQIRSAMQEQTEGSKQILESLKIMGESTTEVRNAAKEMTTGSAKILEEVSLLRESSTQMTESVQGMDNGTLQIKKTGGALNDISAQMVSAINQIGTEIDEFKV